ncbi:uncharacterized protein LOC103314458 [Tribolium castaneum]|uniref:Uncharacterized protein n=1 Tax=Tribolium castaneum TaxID=7070 RepID=D6X4G9_TRICA|nr:PREDICTED: uncharacterized protein LOC103314458 [Tribolium castaneum]EEZ97557.1 hypothetical protein TcasGA2_TC011408 [Tribolium castaneum]|eukprot:XP_008198804.1 PREDICTED: uncharacterized protein LOC103314458 [Tribolium castaneum]
MEENLSFIIECLKERNYPQIHEMEECKICDIFSTPNRSFLVSWILQQINVRFAEICANADKEKLAEIIYCHGFCDDAKESLQFMNGECDLSKQFFIMSKMFKALETVPETITSDVNNYDDLMNFDSNLFPTYGSKQTLTLSQRAAKIQEYRKEIADLKAILNSRNQNQSLSIDSNLKQQLEDSTQQLEDNFLEFKSNVQRLLVNHKEPNEINFPEDASEVIESCCKNSERLLKFMKSLNTIVSFKRENLENVEKKRNGNYEMLKELAELCREIKSLK